MLERLLVGLRASPARLCEAIGVCRLFRGKLVSRYRDTLVFELIAASDTCDAFLRQLPAGAVTHVSRTDGCRTVPGAFISEFQSPERVQLEA